MDTQIKMALKKTIAGYMHPESGSGGVTFTITQAMPTLTIGEWVMINPAGQYVGAKADTPTNGEVIGVVVAIPAVNQYTIQQSGYVTTAKGIIPQQDIEMHPLEEATIRAHWNIHDLSQKIPPKPSMEDEHEWMIEHGADFIKQRRKECQDIHDALQPELQAAHDRHQKAQEVWNIHAELCRANGFNPDTYDGNAVEKLTMPEIKSNAV